MVVGKINVDISDPDGDALEQPPSSEGTVMRCTITKVPYIYKDKTEDRWKVTAPRRNGKRGHEKWFKREDEAKAYALKIDMKMLGGVFGKRGSSVTFEFACAEWLKKEDKRADHKNRNRDLTKGSLYGKQSDAKCHLLPSSEL
jgi:hypothetical protein